MREFTYFKVKIRNIDYEFKKKGHKNEKYHKPYTVKRMDTGLARGLVRL